MSQTLTQQTTVHIPLKVVAVSSNTNSFGLKEFHAFSPFGMPFKALANSIRVPAQNQIIDIYLDDVDFSPEQVLMELSNQGFECPEYIDRPVPPGLIKEVWS